MIKPNKALEIYLQEFEPHYIKYLNDYYARESSAYVAENGVSLYMIKAEQRLEEEEARAKKYLDNASLERVRSASDGVLVDRHKAAMYAECEGMLRSDKHQDLRRMFKLLSRLKDGVGPMLQVIEDYIKAAGLQAVASLLAAVRSLFLNV
jgi:cullin 1